VATGFIDGMLAERGLNGQPTDKQMANAKPAGKYHHVSVPSGQTDAAISMLISSQDFNLLDQLNALVSLKNQEHGDMHQQQERKQAQRRVFESNRDSNRLPVKAELSPSIAIDKEYLAAITQKPSFNLYVCTETFNAYDERHMSLKKDTVFLGFSEQKEGHGGEAWVFGCPDNELSEFGFVNAQYLQFMRTISTGTTR